MRRVPWLAVAAAVLAFGAPICAQVRTALPVPVAPLPRGTVRTDPRLSPAPAGVTVAGTPLVARLSWEPAPNAIRYAVWRSDGMSAGLERSPAGFIGTAFQDTVPDPRPAWRFWIVAHYADGTWGASPQVEFVSPPLANPTGFTAHHAGGGIVGLQWQPVAGAAQYRIDGPGAPHTGLHQTATAATISGVPAGPATWTVTALYPGNFADYPSGTRTQAVVRVLPPRTVPWLSKNNGPGSPAVAQTHYSSLCGADSRCLHAVEKLVPWQAQPRFQEWGDLFLNGNFSHNRAREEAVYANSGDLGFGRRTRCQQWFLGPPNVPGFLTICYSTSHGPAPGQPGFGNVATITNAASGVNVSLPGGVVFDPWGGMPRSATMIIMDPTGSTFLALTPGVWDMNDGRLPDSGGLSWPGWAQPPELVHALAFDTEGPKAVPHSCLSCHGGTYDPATRKVSGASFLPLDPGLLTLANNPPTIYPASYPAMQEENLRKFNHMIVNSGSSPAVKAYINGLYSGSVGQAGAQARADYVPAGWSAQSGLYRSVVRPYCAMCHLAAPANVNFATWPNFEQNRVAIHASVCKAHTMPHSEIAFKEFWLKDTGPLFLPGLLAASLGFPSCE